MSSSFLTISFLISLIAGTLWAIAWFVDEYHELKRSYYFGVEIWSRWLPVVATGIYLAILAVNLASGGSIDDPVNPAVQSPISLGGFFSIPEIIILFLVGPLFLTGIGNLVAIATVVYCLERMLLTNSSIGPYIALDLLTGAALTVAVLGDKMPWLGIDGPNRYAHKLRDVLLVFMTVAALAVTFTALFKAHGFARWSASNVGVTMSTSAGIALMIALFLGWLSVGLGITRHLSLPILCLPTVVIIAYVTGWASHLLIVPFALCLTLSLATAERRIRGARRTVGVATTVIFTR